MKKKNAKKAYLTTACDHDCNGGPRAILRGEGLVGRGILHVVITSDKYTCGNLFALMSLKVDVPFV